MRLYYGAHKIGDDWILKVGREKEPIWEGLDPAIGPHGILEAEHTKGLAKLISLTVKECGIKTVEFETNNIVEVR